MVIEVYGLWYNIVTRCYRPRVIGNTKNRPRRRSRRKAIALVRVRESSRYQYRITDSRPDDRRDRVFFIRWRVSRCYDIITLVGAGRGWALSKTGFSCGTMTFLARTLQERGVFISFYSCVMLLYIIIIIIIVKEKEDGGGGDVVGVCGKRDSREIWLTRRKSSPIYKNNNNKMYRCCLGILIQRLYVPQLHQTRVIKSWRLWRGPVDGRVFFFFYRNNNKQD